MPAHAHDMETVFAALQEASAFGGAPPFWAEALSAMPAGPLPFLDPAGIPARRSASGLPPERDAPLGALAVTVAGDTALRCLAWYLHWIMFIAINKGAPWGAPALLSRLGTQAGLFYELLALPFASRLAVWHRQLGYPPEVTTQTVRQISSFDANHLRGHGYPGIYPRQFAWLAVYLVEPYVRLGRFEFLLHSHDSGIRAWKRNRDGFILALAPDGTRVDGEGLRLRHDAPAETGWTAHLSETADAVSGFPVAPTGHLLPEPIRLARSAWTPCLDYGMTLLDLHIPAGGGMTWDAMTDSFRQALDFFARHHAERPVYALHLSTWFMDPQLAELLPADANPIRLQHAAYLYPTPPDPGGLWFVFLRETGGEVDPATLPRDTALQRRLASFLESGKRWRGGGMFMLPEQMRNPREGFYREDFEDRLRSR